MRIYKVHMFAEISPAFLAETQSYMRQDVCVAGYVDAAIARAKAYWVDQTEMYVRPLTVDDIQVQSVELLAEGY